MDLLKPIALLLLSYGIVVWGGSTFVRIILRRLRETKPGNKTEPGSLQVSEEINEKREMKGVGRYTGYLERFLVFNAYYFKQKTDIVLLLLVVFLLMAKLIILWNYHGYTSTRLCFWR